ncbi:MAG: AraC family transcriptional regulator, partial [Vibrio toranzoniae]|uniref:helix-turn-helix domain-containing protein n=1 Tax=Vibrio toranzoniae TaxID=1194427 RepID=UPI003C373BFF
GTVEFGGLDNPPSKSRIKNLINNAKYMLGDLPEHEDEWLGFRPSLPDFLPVMGPSKNHKNVFFIIETSSNNLSCKFEELKEKTQHIFDPHFDIDRNMNKNNQLPAKIFASEVVNFIMRNINRDIRETEIADRCHCSTTYFSKKFHLHFGVSFRDFVCDKRILLAKKLIEADTESKIAVIAYQCGYKDVSYFSRIFKKRTGVTPASYRRTCMDNRKR